jgi:hypothetical protein
MRAVTPPWQVDAWDLASDLAKIEQQQETLGAILGDATRFDLRHPATSGWGCGEHAGHSAIAAFGIAKGIERALAEPERDRNERATESSEAILRSGVFPPGRVQAPERLDPTTRSRAELVALATGAAAVWSTLSRRADELAVCPARFRHFLLGHLTSAEWVRFCAIHTAHHLLLVREVEAAAGGESSARGPRV